MMLVENDAVEAEFLAVRHFLQMLAIILRAFHRIEKITGHRRTRRVFRNMRIGEQIEIINFHADFAPPALQ
jgi:hypothetical protein